MVNLTIDNIPVSVPNGTTILDAAAATGIHIPSLCYLKDINEIGACRVCTVELENCKKLVAACVNPVEEGMVVKTNSPRVRAARKINVELILSQHNFKCMRCIQVCDKIQDLHVWDVAFTGSRTTVDVSHNRRIANADCSLCGQCITHCPVGALRARDDTQKAFDALADPDKITVVQIAPAVRSAWGESLGLPDDNNTVKKLAATLRRMGFDYIFDTDFSADLTIMEEASELLDRLTHKYKHKFPMFTSCCPGWVRFLKSQYPDMTDNLSTAKSPQQMFGAIAKSYFAQLIGVDPKKIYCVSIMPCVAKKHECAIPVMNDACGDPDVDLVLTTRELERMTRAEHIDPAALEPEELDDPLGIGSGAGAIFGTTGGVMEAALRTAYALVMGENPDPDLFQNIRGMEGWREATVNLKGEEIRIAIVSGLGNTRKIVEAIRAGKVQYDFVEVMACPGGCAGGGGQPIHEGQELAAKRGERLRNIDSSMELRFSHENPSIKQLYADYLGEPLSHKSHTLLHTDHNAWSMPQAIHPEEEEE